MFIYSIGATTDRGDVRKENQDNILLLDGSIENQPAALLVVADGMGGLSYGAYISRYITERFEQWWNEDFPQLVQDRTDCEDDIRESLEQEIWDINQEMLDFKNKMRCRSGSTLSLLLLYKERYYIENIGDSRVYLERRGRLAQLTSDQSLAAQMVRSNRMTEAEAQYSKMKNMLTMCIGMFPVPQSGYSSDNVLPGDCFLLCSDGLYHPLCQTQIGEVLNKQALNAQEKAECLRKMIIPGLAKDNVSAVVVEVKLGKAAEKEWRLGV